MEKRAKKILNTIRYGDENWEDVLIRVNREGGVDLKTLFRLVGIVMDELQRQAVPIIPTVFPANENGKKEKDNDKKRSAKGGGKRKNS